jgi:hypothetical protein
VEIRESIAGHVEGYPDTEDVEAQRIHFVSQRLKGHGSTSPVLAGLPRNSWITYLEDDGIQAH